MVRTNQIRFFPLTIFQGTKYGSGRLCLNSLDWHRNSEKFYFFSRMSKSSTVLEVLKRPTNYFFLNFIVELVRNILNLEEYSDQFTEVANKKI